MKRHIVRKIKVLYTASVSDDIAHNGTLFDFIKSLRYGKFTNVRIKLFMKQRSNVVRCGRISITFPRHLWSKSNFLLALSNVNFIKVNNLSYYRRLNFKITLMNKQRCKTLKILDRIICILMIAVPELFEVPSLKNRNRTVEIYRFGNFEINWGLTKLNELTVDWAKLHIIRSTGFIDVMFD